MLQCIMLILFASLFHQTSQKNTAWVEFDLDKSDHHLINEHFVKWMFGDFDHDSNEYYFQAHDSDDNSKLDGLELLHALHHQNTSRHMETSQDHFHEDSVIVDLLLKQADSDNDGFLDYYEYIVSRKLQDPN